MQPGQHGRIGQIDRFGRAFDAQLNMAAVFGWSTLGRLKTLTPG
jgi:cell wall assembly regulator SMI1